MENKLGAALKLFPASCHFEHNGPRGSGKARWSVSISDVLVDQQFHPNNTERFSEDNAVSGKSSCLICTTKVTTLAAHSLSL